MTSSLKDHVIKAIAEAAGVGEAEVILEHPAEEIFGDYSTNIALKLKGGVKLAEEIVSKIKPDEVIEKATVAGPGFVNISIHSEALINILGGVLSEANEFGSNKASLDKKIMVEFAHPNTHKELHIGHMRTLITGESVSRVLENAGAKIFRANYQGDIGPHVAKAIWGLQKIMTERKLSFEEADKMTEIQRAHLLGEGYVRGSSDYENFKAEIDSLNTKLYQKSPDMLQIYQKTRTWSLDYYELFYKRFGTKFDRLFFESEVFEEGKKIVLENVGKVFSESEGAVIFDGEKFGLHKRVFVTADGNPTYEAKEMALAKLEYKEFPFDKVIHVVANEQTGYFQMVIKAIEELNSSLKGKEFHLQMGMVNLVGRKMASRTGDILTVDGLLDEVKTEVEGLIKNPDLSEDERRNVAEKVTLGAVKYSVLKVDPKMNVAFDIKQSVSLEGNSGPYLQYTYARTRSVLNKSQITNHKSQNISYQANPEEMAILRWIYRFPEVTAEAAMRLGPNLICNYLYELAGRFNAFYNKHSILTLREGENAKQFRLAVTAGTAIILEKGLKLLGIEVLERM